MTEQNVLIKYNIDQIFACREANCIISKELMEYCSHLEKSQLSILTDLIKPMDDVTKSHSHGINPNDITLKNVIRENLNKLNNKNSALICSELKSLNYCNENHFGLLASELIIKSMNDPMASKGYEVSKTGQKTPSELYMDVAKELSNFFTEKDGKEIKFKTVMSKECQQYFNKLTNKNESMDKNNPHKVSNYKGFMNMMGLMYSYGLFPKEIIKVCFNKIVLLILDAQLPQEECDNYYSGYERLMNRILSHFERTTPTKSSCDDFNQIKPIIIEMNTRITNGCETSKPLRTFSLMTHKQNILRFEKLCDLYEKGNGTQIEKTN